MRKLLIAALLLGIATPALAAAPYRILRIVTVGGDGGFDYVTADSAARRLYVARSGKDNPRLVAFDLDTLKPVGEITGISAHGAAIDAASGHGIASSKPLTLFDARTLAVIKKVTVAGNPDGLAPVAGEGRVYVLSHSAPNITVVDPASGAVTGTVALGAAPEQSASDGKGHLYVDLEDGDAVAVVDTRTLAVTARYPLAGKGGTPAGLALDDAHRVLFVACRNPATLVMMNADTGAILGAIPIGKGTDGAVFNPATGEAFTSQGDGTLAVVKQQGAGFALEQSLVTTPGAKTLTLDSKTGHIFLIAADYGPVPADRPPPSNGRIARGPVIPGSFKILEVGR